jgi:DNA-binding NtrC family response regulator
MSRVLLIDDEPRFCQATSETLRGRGHDVATANGVAAARELLRTGSPDLILLDLMLPDGNGLELLEQLEADSPSQIVIITGHPAIKAHIQSLAGPSVSYLTKPVDMRDILRLVDELDAAPEAAPDEQSKHFGLLIGESPCMQRVYQAIRQFGPTAATVLIQGASGTGKELVAEALHRASGRGGQFVPVNCGALMNELVGSELFGHEKGSFTGATRRHKGLFERAHGGTLFLDEIGEMQPHLQAYLLRALESGEIIRVGGERETQIDTRLLAATNRNPADAVEEGVLRQDLYYRLSEFVISLRPLRERGDDIALLATYFVDQLNRRYGTAKRASPELIERCMAYSWPGNVRELKHVVHRVFLLHEETDVELEPDESFDGGLAFEDSLVGVQAGRPIRDVERELILKTLSHFDGDKKAASETLGISLKTLYNRLHQYDEGAAGD